MKKIMTDIELVQKMKLALDSNTVYATGGFGASISNFKSQLERYCKNSPELKQKIIECAAKGKGFAFDCVGLVKSVSAWGWCADETRVYGGAVYESNGVDDWTIDTILNKCEEVSTDFSNIQAGEMLYMKGHVGVYIGDGMAIECTTAWECKVQLTECWNVKKTGRGRAWEKHGRLPWITYSERPKPTKNKIVCPCCGAVFMQQ